MKKNIYSFFLIVLVLVTSPFLIRYLLTNQKISILNSIYFNYPGIINRTKTCPSYDALLNTTLDNSFSVSIINNIDSVIISILPQPYDFDSFEPMSDNYQGTHYSLNPKFEDANIGIGSVIRERRKNFVKTWKNIYFLQPLNKAALMHIYPYNWLLFKEENKKYFFKKEFEIKPDNESIFVNL